MVFSIAVAGPVLLALLLLSEKTSHTSAKLIFKQVLSALFIIVVWSQPAALSIYGRWVLTGLILSWMGDLFLVFITRNKVFLAGLVSFLLAHLCYATAFFTYGRFDLWLVACVIALVLVGLMIFFWLRPHLGNMQAPVIAYMVVITLMMIGAVTFFFNPHHPPGGRWWVLTGAILFFLSDILVARDRFVAPGFANSLLGLPLYYMAQFLFAFSVGQI